MKKAGIRYTPATDHQEVDTEQEKWEHWGLLYSVAIYFTFDSSTFMAVGQHIGNGSATVQRVIVYFSIGAWSALCSISIHMSKFKHFSRLPFGSIHFTEQSKC